LTEETRCIVAEPLEPFAQWEPINPQPPPPVPLPGSGLNPPSDPPRVAAEQPEPEDDGEGEDEPDDCCEYVDVETQKRLWVRTIIPLLQLRSHDSDPSGRVQLAFDLMHIAACERMARILRDDLPADGG
jgi:hypothetical protein